MDRQEWLEWRRSGIGGSDAGTVVGVNPYSSWQELFLDKTGRLPERTPNRAMLRGLRLEPAIAQAYSERTGETFATEQECIRSDQFPFMLATLDRRTTEGKIIELKSVGFAVGDRLGESGDVDSLPGYWIAQAQHQMIVAKRDLVTFAVFTQWEELRTYEVERDDLLCDSLITSEREFWGYVERDEMPARTFRVKRQVKISIKECK